MNTIGSNNQKAQETINTVIITIGGLLKKGLRLTVGAFLMSIVTLGNTMQQPTPITCIISLKNSLI